MEPEREALLEAARQCDGLTYAIERVHGLRNHGRTECSRPSEVQAGGGDADGDVSRLQLVGDDQRRDADYEVAESISQCWDGCPSTAF